MAEDIDFNDAIDDIFLSEESKHKESYDEGFSAGCEGGNPEGFHLGYHRGAEIGRELGHYLGIVTHHLTLPESTSTTYSDKIIRQLQKVKELIDALPKTNSEEHDILQMLGTVRAQYKKACALLKIPSSNPYGEGTISKNKMDPTTIQLRQKLDSITSYLTPLLPMANCHMVEFITENHWETFVPEPLRKDLEAVGIDEAVNKFWMAAEGSISEATSSNLHQFVSRARSHCIPVDNDLCLSVDAVKRRIKLWGGRIAPEIRVTEFMSSKKGYEVQTMSSLVASLFSCTVSSHTVDVGGGRGQLPAVLELGYRVPGLTVDCDRQALESGVRRDRLIRKQWHAISKKLPDEGNTRDSKEAGPTHVNRRDRKEAQSRHVPNKNKFDNKTAELTHGKTNKCDSKEAGLNHVTDNSDSKEAELHRYAHQFVTEETDLCKMVECSFPEYGGEMKLLLTGLHTCGDLGPTSLRLFLRNPETTAAVLTVPCCYHLLSEKCGSADGSGFPMSDYLKGYRLGRNARMLAAQSLERVVSLRQSPARTLFYRALLQVIIKKHLPSSTIPEGRLKRIPAKCQQFPEYVKAADAILNINLYNTLDVTYLTEVDRQYDREWKRMVLFYLLRMCLAQVIESVILLDRLLFLKENGLQKAFLVKLFDPVISPRCHGILSVT